MSNPNNGASLEDCHSNFFALTDLCGIRWRRLVSEGPSIGPSSHGPLDDPVLSSYAKCLAADILCVWRRAPATKSNNQPSTPGDVNPFQQQQQPPPQHFIHPQSQQQQQHMMPPQQQQQQQPHPHLPPPPTPAMALGGMSHALPGPPPYHHQQNAHGFSPHHPPPPTISPMTPQPNPSLNGPKELWIFWYGEEPDFSALINSQLLSKAGEPEQGSWESGLSYECRTLLFKALHNLIEKCLLARDFVRIGKWFIQPVDDSHKPGTKAFPMQLSFSFSFFLHGESTVCMSVDVRQHPSIKRINKHHLAACQTPNQTLPVILAPHGLSGTLTGVGYRLSESATSKILDEWKQFYPVEAALKSSVYDTSVPSAPHSSPHPTQSHFSNQGIPPVLEVTLGGVRMRYPACYILVTESDDIIHGNKSNMSSNSPKPVAPKTPKSSRNCISETAAFPSSLSPGKPTGSAVPSQELCKIEGLLPERVWQEAICGSNKENTEQQQCNNAALSQWDFVDPTKRSPCSCSKCKRSSGSRNSGGGMSMSQSTKSGTKMKRHAFHRRILKLKVNHWADIWDSTEDKKSQSSNSQTNSKSTDPQLSNQGVNSRVATTPGTPVGGPPSFKTGPGSISGTGIGSEGPILSPASVAPSPLPTPRSQPSSVPQQEPCMPTLSPQPINDKVLTVSPDTSAPKSVSSVSHQVYSPLVSSFDGCGKTGTEPTNAITTTPASVDTTAVSSSEVCRPSTTPITTHQAKSFLCRPTLPCKDYESLLLEEDASQPSDTIYDYSSLEAWLSHPVKRVRTNDGQSKASLYKWGWGMKKLSNHVPSNSGGYGSLGKRHADPYEFDDENHQTPNSVDAKRKEGDDEKSPHFGSDHMNNKGASGNLLTTEGLLPTIRDLDNLFDNSDTSSDETFQVPTPPGSNKPVDDVGIMSSIANSSSNKTKSGLGALPGLRPEELSKMFPTPPSHEPNPISSPIGLQSDMSALEQSSDNAVSIRRQTDNYLGVGSPPDEPVEVRLDSSAMLRVGGQHQLRMHLQDWSYVFKPPTAFKVLGSTKYSPLPVLPSGHLAPLLLPPAQSTYKARWESSSPAEQPAGQSSLQQTVSVNAVSTVAPTPINAPPTLSNQMHLRPGLSPISPASTSIRGGPFELGSPPGSMYLKSGSGGPLTHGHVSHLAHSAHGHVYGSRGVEAHALVVNLSLSDSVLNLFRDHNFDSCTMCVCNASSKVIGNIRGSEVGLYIQDTSVDVEPVRCNCGFSASANRRLAHHSGLFYEDEFEITTAPVAAIALPSDEWFERKKPGYLSLTLTSSNAQTSDKEDSATPTSDDAPPFLLELLREQCFMMFGTTVSSRFAGEIIHSNFSREFPFNLLECVDANRAALTALEHGRTVMIEASGRQGYSKLPDDTLNMKHNLTLMHKWSFCWAKGPKSSQDVMQVMRALSPLIQEAVHSRAWDSQAQYTVSGPLTWRQFHRLAGRGTDDRCEPQPIPSILVGAEKDWIALSPLAIQFWEKLLLEPYSYSRDVAYIVVAPDNDLVVQKVRTFFREFSSMYEICQLGRHCPISKVLRDGILRVGKTAANNLSSEPVDDWFRSLPDNQTSAALKLYAQVCRHYLAPQLSTISLDQTLFSTNPKVSQDRLAPSPKVPPPTIDVTGSSQGPPTPKIEHGDTEAKEIPVHESNEEDERETPALVVYIVEPFGFSNDNDDIQRLSKLGLLRCYHSMLQFVPENIKNNMTLQIISLEDIMNLGNSALDTRLRNDQMRTLALSVYSQCRRLLVHQNSVKSLTGFGPAAAAADFFVKHKEEKSKSNYRLYTPPYILAPAKERLSEGSDWLNALLSHTTGGLVCSSNALAVGSASPPSMSSVLYVAYCLTEDQRWLLASVTDDRGELLETTTINIYVPNRSRRRKVNARRHGLQKLMDFMLGIMSTGFSPWRLVVGRLGRIGHGELEIWSSLLSRKSLLRASNQLKGCGQCSLQFPTETPCVLSACLVSLEPDSCLRLMPDKFTPDERFSSLTSASLSTPQDISCTHILVFPTSATTQSSQTAFQQEHINGPELGDEDDLLFMVNEGIDDGIDGMNNLDELGDIFNNWPDAGPGASSPNGSPRRDSTSQPGSPGIGASGRQSPFQSGGQGRMSGRSDGGDEVGTLLQQPLALGYLVSTAPSGPLPSWFWSSCPQRANEKGCGVFLKSALHLRSHSVFHNMDDLLQHQSNAKQHPLDSQYTTDVLRFVLEGYNALSWLSLDAKTHDRKSCLPVHIQQLLQLYYTMQSLA